jgi:uncharacterized membrane protein YgcG
MKTKVLSVVVCLATLVCVGILTAQPVQAEVIRSFDVDLALDKTGLLDVVETITMDFEDSAKHGIYRFIPVLYRRYDNQYSTHLADVTVTDGHNNPLHFVRTDEGDAEQIKIGDADITVTGVHVYKIHYSVRRALNFFGGKPELYWNATGNAWPYAVENATVRFYPPDSAKAPDIQYTSYVGSYRSTSPGKVDASKTPVRFHAEDLQPGQGLTIVADMPAGSIEQPSSRQELFWFLNDWWPAIVLPLLAFWTMISLWFYGGRDPKVNETVAVEWNPPTEMSPAEVGTIVDERCDIHDIVATVIDLASRGYLKITELKQPEFLFLSSKDYQFDKLSPPADAVNLKLSEREMMKYLFETGDTVLLSQLKDRFYVNLPELKKAIFSQLTDGGYLSQNPENIRNNYNLIGFLIFGSGFFFAVHSLSWASGVFASAFIVFISGAFMSARTLKGVQAKQKALGFQLFVAMAEKERIAKLAKDDPTIFGRMLGYALVLGAADQWANAFHDLMTEPPSWYVPYGYGTPDYTFSSRGFVHDLGGSMNAFGQGFTSAPSGSSAGSGGFGGGGGGFSGGGFGGGGGGSW